MHKGSITLYLSISMSLILSLICYTVESSHLSALSCRAEGVSYICQDSLFSNYCLQLLDKYGLFALNSQDINIEQSLLNYAKANCKTPKGILGCHSSLLQLNINNVDMDSITYMTDNDGQIFIEQVNEYLRYINVSHIIESLIDISDTDFPDIYSQSEDGIPDINFGSIDVSMIDEYTDKNIERTGNTTENIDNIDSTSFLPSAIANLSHHLEYSLLACLVDNPSSVSTAAIEKTFLPSVTCQLSEDGLKASYGYFKDASKITKEKAGLCQYAYEMFGCYTDPNKDEPLQYQLEYIISGQDSDDVNLLNAAYQLIALRTGLNLVHLVSDSDKFNAAWSIAQSASAVPGLSYIIQGTILTVWATAEAIIDVRLLLEGNNIPLLKSSIDWRLSINGLTSFSKQTVSSQSSTSDTNTGLSYSQYLRMLIAAQNIVSVSFRILDLIQMDICHTIDEDFRISKCVTGAKIHFAYELPFLLSSSSYTYNSIISYNYN